MSGTSKTEYPKQGTVMYSVHEHLYRAHGLASPLKEYCVCEGKVTGILKGSYEQVFASGKNPDGYQTSYYYHMNEIGKKVFYTRDEAVALAKKKTEDYERRWGWLGEPEIPLRRPWEVEP